MEDLSGSRRVDERQLVIDAHYSQYYLVDPSGASDTSFCDVASDGIVGPLDSAMRIDCGTDYGQLKVTFRVVHTLDSSLRGNRGLRRSVTFFFPAERFDWRKCLLPE
jgi:hypothetical protein